MILRNVNKQFLLKYPEVALFIEELRQKCLQRNRVREVMAQLRRFHEYKENSKTLEEAICEFKKFVQKSKFRPAVKIRYVSTVRRYFDYLHQKKLCDYTYDQWLAPICSTRILLLDEHAQQYLKLIRSVQSQASWENTRRSIAHLYYWLAKNNYKVQSVDRNKIENWLISFKTNNTHPSTVVAYIDIVRRYLEWLQQNQIIKKKDQLFNRSDFPKTPKYLPRPLSEENDREIMNRLRQENDMYSSLLFIMRKAGLRCGETCDLTYNCIIHTKSGDFLKIPLGKFQKERTVPIDKETLERIAVTQKLAIKNSQQKETPQYLFTIGPNEKIESWRIPYHFKKITEGLKDSRPIQPHRLRHTFATQLISNGMNLVTVMKLLGHNDVKTTLRYAAVTPQAASREYFEAISKSQLPQEIQKKQSMGANFGPAQLCTDLMSWVKNNENGLTEKNKKSIYDRIAKIKMEIKKSK